MSKPATQAAAPPSTDAKAVDAATKPERVSTAVPTPAPTLAPAQQDGPEADIRGVVIQLAGARLLLPNAAIAEVLSFAPPEPVEGAPGWLLGRMRWRGWQVPLISFSQLAGLADEQGGLGSKVIVFKALGGDEKAPYFAILTQGFPRLVTVSRAGLAVDSDGGELPLAVHSRVTLNQDDALVPDLVAIERLIADALSQAA